jgi:hypothetical protein
MALPEGHHLSEDGPVADRSEPAPVHKSLKPLADFLVTPPPGVGWAGEGVFGKTCLSSLRPFAYLDLIVRTNNPAAVISWN